MDNYSRNNNNQKRDYNNNNRNYHPNNRQYDYERRMNMHRNYEDNRYPISRRFNEHQMINARQNYSVYARRPIYREERGGAYIERRRFVRRSGMNEKRTDVPTKEELDADLAKYMRGEVMDTFK